MADEIKLRVVLKSPPPGVDYGLQSGQGNPYEVVGKQRSGKGDLKFELQVGTKERVGKSAELDFTGHFVQGKAGDRFFYIDIGTYAGQTDSEWGRRLKIPLRGISKAAAAKAKGKTFETVIAGTGKDGGPSCATPKDFTGWKVKAPLEKSASRKRETSSSGHGPLGAPYTIGK